MTTTTTRGPVTLSSGRTFTHRRMENGAQEVISPEGTPDEMTEAEWTEYCAVIRRPAGLTKRYTGQEDLF